MTLDGRERGFARKLRRRVARVDAFGHEIERMRYRGGVRRGYASRLHYFSEWIYDGAKRGLVTDIARELGGVIDPRPLRFMTEHRKSYAALANDDVFKQIGEMERLYKLVNAASETDKTVAEEARAETAKLQAGDSEWEMMVPPEVKRIIKERGFFGFRAPKAA